MPLGDWLRPNWKHSDPSVRKAAVESLEDKAILAETAKSDTDPGVRVVAVERLDDEAILADIAQHDADPSVRLAAVQRLDDEAILLDILNNDEESSVRQAAVWRLDDEASLTNIARLDGDPAVRKAAVGRLVRACEEKVAPDEAAGAEGEPTALSPAAARDALIDLVLADPAHVNLVPLICESGYRHSDGDRQLLFLALAGRFDDCLAEDPELERLQAQYLAASSEIQNRVRDAIRRAGDRRMSALFVTGQGADAPPEVRADLSAEEADLLVDLHAGDGSWDEVPKYLELLPPRGAFCALLSVIFRAPLDSMAFAFAASQLRLVGDQHPEGPFMSALFANTDGYRSLALDVLQGAEVERFFGWADAALLRGLAMLFLQAGLSDDDAPAADRCHDRALQLLAKSLSEDSAGLVNALAELQRLCRENERFRAAVKYAEHRYELDPTDAAGACDLAWALNDCSQPERGCEVLKRLIKGNPFVGVEPYQMITDLLCLLGLEEAEDNPESAIERYRLAQKYGHDAYVLLGVGDWWSQKDAELKEFLARVTTPES